MSFLYFYKSKSLEKYSINAPFCNGYFAVKIIMAIDVKLIFETEFFDFNSEISIIQGIL